MIKKLIPAVLLFFFFVISKSQAQVTLLYKESMEDFPNPERGFYIPAGKKPGDLLVDELKKLREVPSIKSQNPNEAKAVYSVRVSLIMREYLLADFKNTAISEAYLQKIKNDFDTIRQAGLKVILRFCYTNKTKSGDCPDEYKICPPYGDAPKNIVLQHIAQLKPLLTDNADIIAVMQQGFIGIWGENYFTDFFGDASTNGLGVVADSSWKDRNDMLKALLDALPKSRMIQVRTPQIKQRYVYGPQAPVASAATNETEAFSFSDQSRIALHNDCFLASKDDYGTFYNYGNSTSPRGPANEVLRKYFAQDSRYVAVGGETCDDAYSPQNDCAAFGGHAEEEMAGLHYSFLNAAYNNLVNNDWETQGCMMNIKRKLGYRFVLRKAVLPKIIDRKKAFAIELQMENVGFASPFNPRTAELVLRNTTSGKLSMLPLKANIQKWFTGIINLKETWNLPADISTGDYEILLNFPDAYSSLKNRPEYSIRLANENMWEGTTGFNNLRQVITIKN